jgi:hypothetical protein
MRLVQKEKKIEIEKKEGKSFAWLYDSLTKTPYIFFGDCSIFLLGPKIQ